MTCDCAFSIDYRLGESIAFVVDILIWNEETSAYEPVESLADWSGKYILKQGDTVLQFETPDSQILVETDSPYLFPAGGNSAGTGAGGKPLNKPCNLKLILGQVAELRGMDAEALAYLTSANTRRALL